MTPVNTLPQLSLELNDLPVPVNFYRPLTGVYVRQALNAPAQCELVFSDPPGSSEEMDQIAQQLSPGTHFRLKLVGIDIPLFIGQVTGNEYTYRPDSTREIRIRAYDLLHSLRKRQQVRAHVQVTPVELATEMVSTLGLSVQAALKGPLYPRVIQHAQSDYDLLCELLDRCGLYFTLRDDVLHLLTLEGLDDQVDLRLGETLLEARLEINTETASSSIRAQGWDPLGVEPFEGQKNQPRSGRSVEAAVDAQSVGGDGERWLVGEDAVNFDHIEALAQAELDRRAGNEVTMWGVAQGNPSLRPGTRIEIAGVNQSFSGKYVLTKVTHTIDTRSGYITQISSQPPGGLRHSQSAIAALGVVTRVDDPEKFGRVKASLPAYNNVETEWMQVIHPAAGVNKGLVALPGVEDTILILFTHADPARGVVLGGFYGPFAPYDPGVDGNAVKRYSLRTPQGHLIRLDDEKQVLRFEHSRGSYVEMTPDKVTVYAAADLEISAPGKQIVIQGAAIDFRKA